MSNTPTDICNQALDSIGLSRTIGDIQEGSRESQVLLRAYGQCLRQLLRGANWNFARKTSALVLLADATGQTPDVGVLVPRPWAFSYAYPPDCMRARFVPDGFNEGAIAVPRNNIQVSAAPLTTGPNPPPWIGQRERCARWVEATDFNYPPPPGEITWEVQGVSPEGRTVILTNKKHAHLVYTALMLYPSVWDAMFREALVAYLASQVALALWEKDRKFGLEVRNQQIAITKEKLIVARMNDGNEGVSSSDVAVDWLSFRRTGGYGRGEFGNGHGDIGMLMQGDSTVGFLDGTAF